MLDKIVNCTSCGVCASVCPAKCITLKNDKYGFYRPQVNTEKCIQCGLCLKVCSANCDNVSDENCFKDKAVYAAYSKDKDALQTCSSGGIAHELLKWGINNGYSVCGVVYDPNEKIFKHTITQSDSVLDQIKGSKYVQSFTPEAFASFDLNQKYIVVGTPCQIYSLRQWITHQKVEENFVLVDFFCHGTPSNLLWQKLLNYALDKYKLDHVLNINFRFKKKDNFRQSNNIKITAETNNKIREEYIENEIFYSLYFSKYCLNTSCYSCVFRHNICSSDIRIGDFWGDKYKNSEIAHNIVVINSSKGTDVFSAIRDKLNVDLCSFEDLVNAHPARFFEKPDIREHVISMLQSFDLYTVYKNTLRPKYLDRIRNKLKVRYRIKKLLLECHR
ncbi:MAG: Coenzyme F420 hydrogenase/dehydrogenase, beta subunit C-terminal domain [Bacteroidales bacterium]|nr:Coenzyme F420 hydrogenase/dehydrogenase, beta subunit C-terminal domain [Bacteroidales bacterium]